jgi:D-sedoheptulose 7-phosphate isomerase
MLCVSTEKGAYEVVEDIHSVVCHALTKCLIADRAATSA